MTTNLTKLALKRPVTITMAFLAMLLMGLVSSRLLPLEMFPGLEIPQIMVEVPYQGASPQEVERGITTVLEESLATLSDVKSMRSHSTENGAFIEMRFDWGVPIATKTVEARERLDSVRHLLPTDVERVLLRQFSTADMPIYTLRISSKRDLSGAYDLLESQLKRPLERLPGVSQVTLYGVDKPRIEIRVDADALATMGINPDKLQQRLNQENFTLSGGTLRSQQTLWQLSPKGEFRSVSEIENLVLRPGLRLGDVAEIGYTQAERIDGRHLNRAYAIGLDIFKESGANLVEVADRVTKVIAQANDNPQFQGIELFSMDDQAQGVKSSLHDLLMAGLIGAGLSFGVLFLFLRNIPMTLIVVVSVPISIAITLAAMYLMNYSLNILSMMGLLLAVGMLIDNSVVVTESVLQAQESGKYKGTREAILAGVNKVALAVMAGTLTTIIVFLPNIFGTKVQLTMFLEHVAIAICISLLASLLLAKTLLPLLLSRLKGLKSSPKGSSCHPRYRKWLTRCLEWPKTSGVIALVLLASTALPISQVKMADDDDDNTRLYLRYHLQERQPVAVTEAMVDRVEEYLFANQAALGFDSIYSYYATDNATTTLIMREELPATIEAIKQTIRDNMPSLANAEPEFGWGGGDDSGMRITLTGRSTTVLMELAEQLVPLMNRIEGLEDVRSDAGAGQQELVVQFDRQLLSRLGLEVSDAAQTLALAVRGQNLRSFRHDPSGEIQIFLAWERQWRDSLQQLKQLPIVRDGERVYTLEMLASIAAQPQLQGIRHFNRQTALTIGGNVEERSMDEVRDDLTKVLDSIHWPPGYEYSFGGGFRQQQDSEQIMMINMLLAIAMIYIVMAALFESLLLPTAVITSILFSITGVYWTFMALGQEMSIMGMIGILILMGVVVNNGIVLVDQINQREPDIDRLKLAIVDAATSRLRPVLMTVATTVLGLVPLALNDTRLAGGGPSYTPMALAIIGGLLFSTVTSLFLVPYCYLLLSRMRHFYAQRCAHIKQWSDAKLPNWM
ncbi:efflux RND transporter permease subunit [Ferrimonas sediminicola]|uniref:Efflux RND transporter permease subunit n=1 Tax=Ferrimonas sediminicola TaxID=2569538 RepID=A0A4U1BDF6_9GAMM|nr:efflux RND transporter permease subunit [Ferrimonas sediminicola]TKB49006.1 efflux RND transporter permease subunit [Ferrimonas sediminicola]